MRIDECPDCLQHFVANPFILEACASVAMSRNSSMEDILRNFYFFFHKNGHSEVSSNAFQ